MIELRDKSIVLEPHQIEAIQNGPVRLRKTRLIYLRFWMRKGKTFTSLGICHECLKSNIDAQVLFVTEKQPIADIKNDFAQIINPSFNLTVINYESLHKVPKDVKYNIIIIDEAHRLGSFPRKVIAVDQLKIICQNKAIIYLSATPTPESWSQIYHQLFVSSYSPFAKWPSFYLWAKEFVNIREVKYRGVPSKEYDDADVKKIQSYLSGIWITVGKEVGGTGLQAEHVIHGVRMLRKTHDIFNEIKKHKIYINEKDHAAIANSGGELDNKLGQICGGTLKFDETVLCAINEPGLIFDTSKAQFIKSYFGNKKIAILFRFIAEGEMLRAFFPNWTDDHTIFNSRDDLVYIKQIRSARVGIKLNTTDDLVMYNIEHSALSFIQSQARADHMLRSEAAKVHFIFSDLGYEAEIYRMMKEEKLQNTESHYVQA